MIRSLLPKLPGFPGLMLAAALVGSSLRRRVSAKPKVPAPKAETIEAFISRVDVRPVPDLPRDDAFYLARATERRMRRAWKRCHRQNLTNFGKYNTTGGEHRRYAALFEDACRLTREANGARA